MVFRSCNQDLRLMLVICQVHIFFNVCLKYVVSFLKPSDYKVFLFNFVQYLTTKSLEMEYSFNFTTVLNELIKKFKLKRNVESRHDINVCDVEMHFFWFNVGLKYTILIQKPNAYTMFFFNFVHYLIIKPLGI